jgi:DNA-binding CsgD family transcriptional regulator
MPGSGLSQDVTLTAKEHAALELVALGCTNAEIAATLNVSSHAVKQRLAKAFTKLNVRTRAEAAARFVEFVSDRSRQSESGSGHTT